MALALALSGCLATATAYEGLVGPEQPLIASEGHVRPRSTASKVTFYALLPVWLAVDVVTAPFQYVYVITHAK